jgi:hypothetical protein
MLIAAERLLVRFRQVPSRADELISLRHRVRTARSEQPGDEERTIADALRALKLRISAESGSVTSCATCAIGKRRPRGTFAGGDCCSSVTEDLFDDDEVAALVMAGTRPRNLTPPRDEHAGCAFRGETGCTLSAADRPVRCVRYTCMTLRRELRADGRLSELDVLLVELETLRRRFVELRTDRLESELFAPLAESLLKD